MNRWLGTLPGLLPCATWSTPRPLGENGNRIHKRTCSLDIHYTGYMIMHDSDFGQLIILVQH